MEVLWDQVWKHTGAELDSAVLPATAVCPFCKIKSIFISQQVDPQSPPWCWCSQCGYSDDLLATVGRTAFPEIGERTEALSRLIGQQNLDRWALEVAEREKRWKIWDKLLARSSFWVERYPSARYLAEAMKLYRDPTNWRDGVGKMVILTPKKFVAQALAGEEIPTQDGPVDFAAIWPMERRPGWIAGWAVASLNSGNKVIILKRDKYPVKARSWTTGWLGMSWALKAERSEFLYLWNHPIGTMRWHESSWRKEGGPAPVISLHGTEKRPVKIDRSDFIGREPVLIATSFDPIILAAMVDLDASWASFAEDASKYLRESSEQISSADGVWAPDQLHQADVRMNGRRNDWSHYVRLASDLLPETHLRNFVAQAELSEAQRDEMDRRLGSVPAPLRRSPKIIAVRESLRNITETNQGWLFRRTEVISEATVRISELRAYKIARYTAALGEIRCGDEVIHFHEDSAVIEQRSFDWLREQLSAAGIPFAGCGLRWRNWLWKIAMSFSSPKRTVGADYPGWTAARNGFCLPDATLCMTGVGEGCLPPIFRSRLSNLRLGEPAVELLELMRNQRAAEAIATLVSIMLDNILAPVRNCTARGYIIHCRDPHRRNVMDAATALGCLEEESPAWPVLKATGEGIYIGAGAQETAEIDWMPKLDMRQLISLGVVLPACLQLWLKNTTLTGTDLWRLFARKIS